MLNPHLIVERIRLAAKSEGFAACGIAPAIDSRGFSDLVRWIDSGYAASMDYFEKRRDAYRHPSGVLPGAKSVVVLAMPYDGGPPDSCESGVSVDGNADTPRSEPYFGRVARYTWQGIDYHDVIHPKLKRICEIIHEADPGARARGVVDTAPLMEREVAQLAGLGWRGKNTLLLNKSLGSYFFLACVLVDIELPVDASHESSHCGTCTACLDACPTDAFVGPYVLDASKCISYLTIENKDAIPESLRVGVGEWLFGCDVCQEVCPWNRKPARAGSQVGPQTNRSIDETSGVFGDPLTPRGYVDLIELFGLSDDAFRTRFRRNPMWRTRRRGLLRNAAIVLGNAGDRDCLPVLRSALENEEAIVRDAAGWAIEQIRHRRNRAKS